MILHAANLTQTYPVPGAFLRPRRFTALANVTFSLAQGETLALVGESGSGKSTIGRLLAGLARPTAGTITLHGAPVTGPSRAIQMVFQDSAAALNPRRPVADALLAPLLHHFKLPRAEAETQARALLARVGLDPALATRLPHELSGGQRQRIGIARALATTPDILIADEPVSALDVSVRAQILRLFASLPTTTLFITHDLGVVRAIASRVIVLYRGQIVEQGPTATVMTTPAHPYTQALRAATPVPDPTSPRPTPPPTPDSTPLPGCPFRPRCPLAGPDCASPPALRPLSPTHEAACHRA